MALTKEQVLEASKMWLTHSAQDIANVLGVSRNSIMGYVGKNRGLFPNKSLNRKTGREEIDVREPDHIEHINNGAKFLHELGKHECKWPLNDNPPFAFCAEVRKPGSIYCDHHDSRAYYRPANND